MIYTSYTQYALLEYDTVIELDKVITSYKAYSKYMWL